MSLLARVHPEQKVSRSWRGSESFKWKASNTWLHWTVIMRHMNSYHMRWRTLGGPHFRRLLLCPSHLEIFGAAKPNCHVEPKLAWRGCCRRGMALDCLVFLLLCWVYCQTLPTWQEGWIKSYKCVLWSQQAGHISPHAGVVWRLGYLGADWISVLFPWILHLLQQHILLGYRSWHCILRYRNAEVSSHTTMEPATICLCVFFNHTSKIIS